MISLKKIPKVSHSEMRDIAARICRDYLHGAWKTTSAEEIQLRRISGGLSNFLYYVSLPESSVLPGDNIHSSTTTSTSSSPSCANKRPRKDSDNNNNNNAVRLQLDEENLLCGGREPKEVLLRIYGQSHGEHALEAMLTESVVFALLSERRLGPKLHGIFPGGRIEQYIPARPLKTNELANRRISMKISEKMSEIHCLDIPISKEPDWIWKTAHRWLISIENMFNNNTTSSGSGGRSENVAKEEIKTRLRKIDLKGEVQWLRDQLKDESFLVVFSHNDLQEGNILIREDRARNQVEITFADTSETTLSDFEESSNRLGAILIGQEGNGCASAEELKNRAKRNEKLSRKRNNSGQGVDKDKEGAVVVVVPSNPNPQRKAEVEDEEEQEQEETEEEEPELIFIDFEYCSYNYRGFDLANHFLEWTFDYTNKDYPFFFHRKAQFPDADQKRAFLDTYLRTSHRIKGLGAAQEAPTPEELQLVEREIDFFQCASHLFWTLWAIVYCDQEIEFGYWEYADCRLGEYFEAKEKYLLRYKKGSSASGGCVAMQQPIQENGLRASSVSV